MAAQIHRSPPPKHESTEVKGKTLTDLNGTKIRRYVVAVLTK